MSNRYIDRNLVTRLGIVEEALRKAIELLENDTFDGDYRDEMFSALGLTPADVEQIMGDKLEEYDAVRVQFWNVDVPFEWIDFGSYVDADKTYRNYKYDGELSNDELGEMDAHMQIGWIVPTDERDECCDENGWYVDGAIDLWEE